MLFRPAEFMNDLDAYPIAGFREPVSCFTHLLAAPVFPVLGYYLIRRSRGDRGRMVSLGLSFVTR